MDQQPILSEGSVTSIQRVIDGITFTTLRINCAPLAPFWALTALREPVVLDQDERVLTHGGKMPPGVEFFTSIDAIKGRMDQLVKVFGEKPAANEPAAPTIFNTVRQRTMQASAALGDRKVAEVLHLFGVERAVDLPEEDCSAYLRVLDALMPKPDPDMSVAEAKGAAARKEAAELSAGKDTAEPSGLWAGNEPPTDEQMAQAVAQALGVDPAEVQVYRMPGGADPGMRIEGEDPLSRLFTGRDPLKGFFGP